MESTKAAIGYYELVMMGTGSIKTQIEWGGSNAETQSTLINELEMGLEFAGQRMSKKSAQPPTELMQAIFQYTTT